MLDAVSARLSTEKVTELVGKVVIDGQDVATVARDFLTANGLAEPADPVSASPLAYASSIVSPGTSRRPQRSTTRITRAEGRTRQTWSIVSR